MRRAKLRLRSFWIVLLPLIALGCGADPKIGDHCGADGDCPTMCQTGGGFPDGFCTHECTTNADCPTAWTCISDSSGICMPDCMTPDECSTRFGPLWTCATKSRQTGAGAALVCYGS